MEHKVAPTVMVRIPQLHQYNKEYESLMSKWTNAGTREERTRLDDTIDAFEQQGEIDVQTNVRTAVDSVEGVPKEETYTLFFRQRFRDPCPMPTWYQDYQFLGRPEQYNCNPLAICMYILNGEIQAAAMLEYYEYDHQIPNNQKYKVVNIAYLCAVPGNGSGTRCVDHIVEQHQRHNILVRTKALPSAEGFWDKVVAQNDTAYTVLNSQPKMYVWTHGLVTIDCMNVSS